MLYIHIMSDFGTCSTDVKNWVPALITVGVVFFAVTILSFIDKKKVLLLTLLPSRVIILGILWSGSPQSDSVQLDMSFNEVSVGALFLLLVKQCIEKPFRADPNNTKTSLLIFLSIVALVPASVEILYTQDRDTAQWLTGIVSIAVVSFLMIKQTRENPPEREFEFSFCKKIQIALLLGLLTLVSSFADCLGGELWAGLICAFPIDSLIILSHLLEDMKEKGVGTEQRVNMLHQVVYLIALASYTHFTMTVVIYFTSKWEFIKTLSGAWPVVAMVVIAAVSAGIVFLAIQLFALTKRVKRSVDSLLKLRQDDNKSGGKYLEVSRLSPTKLDTFENQRRRCETGSLRL